MHAKRQRVWVLCLAGCALASCTPGSKEEPDQQGCGPENVPVSTTPQDQFVQLDSNGTISGGVAEQVLRMEAARLVLRYGAQQWEFNVSNHPQMDEEWPIGQITANGFPLAVDLTVIPLDADGGRGESEYWGAVSGTVRSQRNAEGQDLFVTAQLAEVRGGVVDPAFPGPALTATVKLARFTYERRNTCTGQPAP